MRLKLRRSSGWKERRDVIDDCCFSCCSCVLFGVEENGYECVTWVG